jgi:hypothetical protein
MEMKMKAWAIFVHSIRQVFGNLPEALQISGLTYLAQMAIAIALGVTTTAMEATTEPTGAEATKVTIAMMAMLIALMWIAVAWHRFVLLNERPAGYLPQLSLQRLGRYAGRSVLIALLSLLIGMVLWLAFGTLFVGLFGLTWLTELLIVICVIVPVLTFLYRLSTILPGVAVDRDLGFADGWVATTGETPTILILAFLSGVAAIVLGSPLALLPEGSILSLLWQVISGWVQMMISASILTTLYGHYIEKRALL